MILLLALLYLIGALYAYPWTTGLRLVWQPLAVLFWPLWWVIVLIMLAGLKR